MTKFNHRQKNKAQLKLKWLVYALATLIIPSFLLFTTVRSEAQSGITALIYKIIGVVKVKTNEGTYVPARENQTTLSNRQHVMAVEEGSQGNIQANTCLAWGGPDNDPSEYNFPTTYGNRWLIAMDKEKACKKIRLTYRVVSRSNKQVKHTKFSTKAIQVSQVGDQPTVIQTDSQNDEYGRKLVVDVLLGTVAINSPLRQGVILQEGQRYIYFLDNQTDSSNIPIQTSLNCTAVSNFLASENWSENVRNQIGSYQPIRKFCLDTPR
jgi:hypothetical protein